MFKIEICAGDKKENGTCVVELLNSIINICSAVWHIASHILNTNTDNLSEHREKEKLIYEPKKWLAGKSIYLNFTSVSILQTNVYSSDA